MYAFPFRPLLRTFFLTAALSPATVGAVRADAVTSPATVAVDEASFRCIREMTPVRHFYVDNLAGNLAGTLAAANAMTDVTYPVGSVIQLVPTEAMVKREAGFNPVTGDWEFFELDVAKAGTTIRKRGFADVNNRFGGNCFGCHVPARDRYDFVCETGHGCEALPINHNMTGALQRGDPRCKTDALQPGDRWMLWKLKAGSAVGSTVGWFRNLF